MLIIEENTLTHVDSVSDVIEHYGKKDDRLKNKRDRDKTPVSRQIHKKQNIYVDDKVKFKKSMMFKENAMSSIKNRFRVFDKTI